MWGSYRSGSDVPCLRDYAAADAHEKKVKPIRGRAVSVKPLGERNRGDAENIRRGAQNEIEVMVGYGGAYVTYYPWGVTRIRVSRGSYSPCTHGALNRLLPYYLTYKDKHTWVKLGDQYHSACVDGGVLIRDGAAVDPPKRYIHKVDRKAANVVRKRYKDFIDYCTGMGRLQTDGDGRVIVDDAALRWRIPYKVLELAPLRDNPDTDPETQYAAFEHLCNFTTQSYWRQGGYYYFTTAKRILDYLNELILKEHKDECFVATDVTGTTQTDKRGWWK